MPGARPCPSLRQICHTDRRPMRRGASLLRGSHQIMVLLILLAASDTQRVCAFGFAPLRCMLVTQQGPKLRTVASSTPGCRPGLESPQRGSMAATSKAETTHGLGLRQLLDFERKGHIKTEATIPTKAQADELYAAVNAEYMRRRKEAYIQKLRLFAVEDEDDDLYQQALKCKSEKEARDMLDSWCKENDVPVPFLQIFNVHRGSTPDAQLICELATSPQMGSMACELLGVPSVRLYQTSVFMKERGHGETSWHADLATAPFDSNHMVTCWIALTPIATEYDSPLEFASGSHRDLALPYWYTEEGMDNPRGDPREYDVDMHLPLVPGDSTWHHGWLYHAAPPNEGERDRLALAVSYVSATARLLDIEGDDGLRREPEDEDQEGYDDWIRDLKGGAVVEHEMLPLVFPPPSAAGKRARRNSRRN